MRLTVGNVVKLVGPDHTLVCRTCQRVRKTFRIAHKVVGVAIRRGWHLHQLGTGQTQHVLFFLTLRFRNDNHGFEPHRRADQRKPDAGVARRAFNNRAAGFQRALGDGILNDEQGGPVLDRLTGVHEFRLAVYLAAGFLARLAQTDKRCVANGLCQIRCDVHGMLLNQVISGVAAGASNLKRSRCLANQ